MNPELKVPQLNYLLGEFPEQHDFIRRLDNLIYDRNESLVLTSQETINVLQPTDSRTFVIILQRAQKTNLVEYCVQVNSSTGEKIEQFPSIMNIPEIMFDPYTGKEFTVLLTHVVANYTFNSPHVKQQKLKIK